jgi:NADH-quinone oxidoreductase subunit L
MPALWLIPLAPLIAALITGFLALTRRAEKFAPAITVMATILSGIVALSRGKGEALATWLSIPPHFQITLGVHLDALALVMVCVVVTVSALVQIYSIGYMAGENGYARYFAYLAIFTASMLGLVTAENLFQLYCCWELVGICSFLLIGFWWSKPAAASAAKKAFVVTRFGDVGFMLGVLLLSSAAGSFEFKDVAHAVAAISHGVLAAPLVSGTTFLWLAPILLFCGAIGKSAQFPLHIWLPDAMEGPTPVSALIHAATMVAAGVYMVARLFVLFSMSAIALQTVLIIGTITAIMAASIALVQNDIKKVLAYSTISQLGYMMIGLGAGGAVIEGSSGDILTTGQTASIFHLVTHAMFKSLLFLTAGSVIHALHHSDDPNDLRKMGGLLQRMPITAWTCLAGVLALSGLFPFSGFWSKDALLAVLQKEATGHTIIMISLAIAIFTAFLTAFYSFRMWLMAFWGDPRSKDAEHAKESPLSMTIPLMILGLASVFLGFFLQQNRFLDNMLTGSSLPAEPWNFPMLFISTLAALLGLGLALQLYGRKSLVTDPVTKLPPAIRLPLVNLWYMEIFWRKAGAGTAITLGSMIAWTDRYVVDRVVAGFPAWSCQAGGRLLRRATNGQTQAYAAVMMAAVAVLLLLLLVQNAMMPILPDIIHFKNVGQALTSK